MEVVPLGQRDRWLSGIDLVDVGMNVVAFEAMNNVRIEVRLTVGDYHGKADLLVEALAYERQSPNGVAKPLVSVSVSCSATKLRSLEAALIHVLYLLDGQLAESELESARIK